MQQVKYGKTDYATRSRQRLRPLGSRAHYVGRCGRYDLMQNAGGLIITRDCSVEYTIHDCKGKSFVSVMDDKWMLLTQAMERTETTQVKRSIQVKASRCSGLMWIVDAISDRSVKSSKKLTPTKDRATPIITCSTFLRTR